MKRLPFILTIVALLLAADWSDAAPGPRKRPRPKDGDYTLIVAGMVSGSGTGSVVGDTLTITAKVTTEGGAEGTVSATLPLTNNHFDGPGKVMGQTATFTGRLDQPDDATELTIKGVRLTCTFKTVSLEYGRIIGNLPVSAATSRPSDRPNKRPDRSGERGEERSR